MKHIKNHNTTLDCPLTEQDIKAIEKRNKDLEPIKAMAAKMNVKSAEKNRFDDLDSLIDLINITNDAIEIHKEKAFNIKKQINNLPDCSAKSTLEEQVVIFENEGIKNLNNHKRNLLLKVLNLINHP
jgi:hypothetical protein